MGEILGGGSNVTFEPSERCNRDDGNVPATNVRVLICTLSKRHSLFSTTHTANTKVHTHIRIKYARCAVDHSSLSACVALIMIYSGGYRFTVNTSQVGRVDEYDIVLPAVGLSTNAKNDETFQADFAVLLDEIKLVNMLNDRRFRSGGTYNLTAEKDVANFEILRERCARSIEIANSCPMIEPLISTPYSTPHSDVSPAPFAVHKADVQQCLRDHIVHPTANSVSYLYYNKQAPSWYSTAADSSKAADHCRCCQSRVFGKRVIVEECRHSGCIFSVDRGFHLTSCQRSVIEHVNRVFAEMPGGFMNVVFLRGVAGTGKTALMRYIVTHLQPNTLPWWMAVKHIVMIMNFNDIYLEDRIYNRYDTKTQRTGTRCAKVHFSTISKFFTVLRTYPTQIEGDTLNMGNIEDNAKQVVSHSSWVWKRFSNSKNVLVMFDEISQIPMVQLCLAVAIMREAARKFSRRVVLVGVGDPNQMQPIRNNGLDEVTDFHHRTSKAREFLQSATTSKDESTDERRRALLLTDDALLNVQVLCSLDNAPDAKTITLRTLKRVAESDQSMVQFLTRYGDTDPIMKPQLLNTFMVSKCIPIHGDAGQIESSIDVGQILENYYQYCREYWLMRTSMVALGLASSRYKSPATEQYNQFMVSPHLDTEFDMPLYVAVKQNMECRHLWLDFCNLLKTYVGNRIMADGGPQANPAILRRFIAPYVMVSRRFGAIEGCLVVGFSYRVHASPSNMIERKVSGADGVPDYTVGTLYVLEQIIFHNFDRDAQIHSLVVRDKILNRRIVLMPVTYNDRRIVNTSNKNVDGIPVVGFPLYPECFENSFQLQGLTLDKDLYIDARGFTSIEEIYVCVSRVTDSDKVKRVINYSL